MRCIKAIFPIACLALAAAPLYAQELSWQEIVAEAKTGNPLLKKSEYSVTGAELNRRKSFSGFLPQLSASAGTGTSSRSALNETSTDTSLGISGSISLFSGFSDLSGHRIAEVDLQNARLKDRRNTSDVMNALEQDYLELLWAQEMVALSERILDRRAENLKLIRLKYDAGREDKGSLLRIEADRLRAEYELAKSERYQATSSEALQRTMGRDTVATTIKVKGEFVLPSLPRDVSLDALLQQTPEYLIAENTVKRSRLEVVSARSSFYPQLSLNSNLSRAGEGWQLDGSRWSVGLNLSFPFFPGNRNIYNAGIADVNRKIAGESFRETRQKLHASLAGAYNNLVDAVENVKVTEKYLEASREQARIATVKYMNGTTSYQDWYSIENDYINTQKSLLSAKKSAMLSFSAWKNLAGTGE